MTFADDRDRGDLLLTPDLTDALQAFFARHALTRVEPAILQPIDLFLELSGEDLRRRLFVTQDGEGRDLCLRPEYTIPVCRDHLAGPGASEAVALGYLGPVFRQRTGEPSEFRQAGFELLNHAEREEADAKALALTLEAAKLFGLSTPLVVIGDMAILAEMMRQLGLSRAAQRRLMRALAAGGPRADLERALDDEAARMQDYSGVLAALEGQDRSAAKSFVEDILSIAGISHVGGRSAGEIADRFLLKATRREEGLPPESRDLILRFLEIRGDPDGSLAAMRALAEEGSLDLRDLFDRFEQRLGYLAMHDIAVEALIFSTGFARNLDYYTGFVFELHPQGQGRGRPLAGGGRYDGLLAHLGAQGPRPAVGASLWLDRMARLSLSDSSGDVA
jgi:ATP phosphoribosyltransferase regulatory subunit